MKYLCGLVLFLLLFINCAGDSQEDLINNSNSEVELTYERDIAPLLSTRCFMCHNNPTANGAPSSSAWINFEIVRDNASIINTRVSNGTMPPAGGLIQAERQLISRWIGQGLKEK